jgi:hypothetical protein
LHSGAACILSYELTSALNALADEVEAFTKKSSKPTLRGKLKRFFDTAKDPNVVVAWRQRLEDALRIFQVRSASYQKPPPISSHIAPTAGHDD